MSDYSDNLYVVNNDRWNKCPCCNSSKIFLIGPVEYRKPILFSNFELDLHSIPQLYECSDCRSWFIQNIIPEKKAMELYSYGDSIKKWPRNDLFVSSKHKLIIDTLDKYFKPGVKVLDIGANTGDLLDFAQSKGAETFAVEPSISSKELLQNKGHTCYKSIDSVDGKYDIITAFDLVEHLHDINGFISLVSSLMVNNSVLIILTGNNQSMSAKLSKNRWWYMKEPGHIVFPSQQFFSTFKDLSLLDISYTYASIGYQRSYFFSFLQFIRKYIFKGGYDGLSSFGPDHMLISLCKKSI